ncbi:MAG: cardiolipin synthase [Acidobacteria bacterium]|nr:cardiolipin synthase [Acidobacteriota bacterium]
MTDNDTSSSDAPAKPRRRRIRRIIIWTLVVFEVFGVFLAIDAIMSTRTAPGAIAWSLSLVTVPVVAVPAYWVFGRSKFEGYLESRRAHQKEIDALVDEIHGNMDASVVQFDTRAPAFDALRGLSRARLVRGNHAELLVDGEATFDSIIEGIGRAEDYVLVEFYIVRDDGLGRRLKDAVIERAHAGVDVAFLYDEIGSADLPDEYTDELREAGVEVSPFNTTQGRGNRFQLNFRNHRKIVVVDGKTAWIGGHNVGDEYLGLDPEYSPWRDTHVRLDGPVAIQAQTVFASDWYWAQRELLDLSWTPEPTLDSDVNAVIVATGPADPLETAGMFFVHALNTARDRIWITAPYFVPDEAIVKAMMLATLRGVDVRIVVPAGADSLLPHLAAFYYMEQLAGSQVKFYSYEPGFMHQKVMLIDDSTVSIGTHNFDNRSFRLNFEVAAVVYDESFNAEVAAMFEEDFGNCVRIDPGTFADRPWRWRFGVRLARLMAPVL